MIQQLYRDGLATKEDYAKAIRAYQKYLDEVRSDHRDQATLFSEKYNCFYRQLQVTNSNGDE
jgi:hypothetical protein